MFKTLLLGLTLAALAATSASAAETRTGRGRVLNGDTLVVQGRVIGLYGIAAPGAKQSCLNAKGHGYECGATSTRALAAHVKDVALTCQIRETDAFGRAVSVCHKDKEDLSAWMVEEGHAVADRREPAYVANETPAWGKRRGLWAGSFEDPTNRKRQNYARPNAVADAQAKDGTP